MQLSPYTLLALGLALVQTSSAVPAPAGALSKRTVDNLPPSDQFVACPGYRYSRAQVEKAIQQGINLTPTNAPQPGMSTLSHHVIRLLTNLVSQAATLTHLATTASYLSPRHAMERSCMSSPSCTGTPSTVVAIPAPTGLSFISTRLTQTRTRRRMARIVEL